MEQRTPALFELNRPLRDKQPDEEPYKAQLEDLQGNILKSHGRGAAVHLFLTFRKGQEDPAKQFLREFAEKLTSAAKQRKQAQTYRDTRQPGEPFAFLCLSASGYEYLGFKTDAFKSDKSDAFKNGMGRANLGDPPEREWEPKFQRPLHAMLILADDRVEKLTELVSELQDKLKHFAQVGIEFGLTMRNADENPIEHFGYADGVSQPIFFENDLKQTTDQWDPRAGPSLVLVPDPYGGSPTACGTYFVFRKLEQNVREFKAREDKLADKLKLTDPDHERAGAMVVGRFEDGTPLTAHSIPRARKEPENDFNYREDVAGNRCPVSAHIRITNPRTNAERGRRIARRGIAYGDPTPPGEDKETLPKGGVGLLFQCCQADVGEQFEYLQRLANDAADPIIGQSAVHALRDLEFPKVYNKPERGRFGSHGFVKMKGGEYFFVPAISFFKSLK